MGDNRVVIVTVSRLFKVKGLCYGIKAFHQLVHQKSLTNVEYNIVGDGPEAQVLKDLTESLGLNGKVNFLGYQTQENVIRTLSKSHIFLLPSIAEALPVVLMEAQAVGLPVIATDVGSSAKLIIEGESGFIVPPEDVDAIADKLEYLVGNPHIWQDMGQKGRSHIQNNYDIKVLNKRLVDICVGLINNKF
jgi:colanic acid/amylovoran biosynthesis glycosyltransferase